MLDAKAGAPPHSRYGRAVAGKKTRLSMRPQHLGRTLALALGVAPLALNAQEAAAPPSAAPSFEEIQATIQRMQERLGRLGNSAAERDQALRFLEQQVEQATGEIAGTDQTNDALRGEAAALSRQVEDLSRRRDELQGQVGERGAAVGALEARVAELAAALDAAQRTGATLSGDLDAARSALAAATAREGELAAKLSSLQADAEAEAKTSSARAAELSSDLDVARSALAAATAREGELAAKLAALQASAEAEAKTASARAAELETLRQRLAGLERTLDDNTKSAAARAAEAEQASVALRSQIGELNRLLASAESKIAQQRDEIDGLDERLTEALQAKVEELKRYRSEFFGKLRQALGDRPDLRVVGDRFVFQSELLFASGSAKLDPAGQQQLRQLALTLQDVAAQIPPGLDWVLRVDGHTDRQPIRDGSFRNNWELSVARAISVIDFLIAQGIPPAHLAAAGFGEYRPIDPADDEVAYRRNRRIEFKLTEG